MSICWVTSFPKSGNTLVRCILYAVARGQVSINELSDICPSFGAVCASVNAAESNTITTLSESAENWSRSVDCVLERKVDRPIPISSTISCLKTHNVSGVFDNYQFPPRLDCKTKIIYVVRHPLSVALSLARHEGVALDCVMRNMMNPDYVAYDIKRGFEHAELRSSWSTHVESWSQLLMKHGNGLMIRFEDMVEMQHAVVRSIGEYLGIDVQVDEIVRAVALAKLKEQETKLGFKEIGKQERFFGEVGDSTFAPFKEVSADIYSAFICDVERVCSKFKYEIPHFE